MRTTRVKVALPYNQHFTWYRMILEDLAGMTPYGSPPEVID
jgi:hypothetical protein